MVWPHIPPPRGLFVSTVTFFDEQQHVDYRSISTHARRLVDSGVTGFVIHESDEDERLLTKDERSAIITHTKEVAAERRSSVTIIVVCRGVTVEQTLACIVDAREAGADYALVPPPSSLATAISRLDVRTFYDKVATHSSLPVIIDDTPEHNSAIELDFDLVMDILNSNNVNVVGIRSASENLTKLQNLSNALLSSEFVSLTARADFVLPILVAGSTGLTSVLANVTPRLYCEALRMLQCGEMRRAQEIQTRLSALVSALSVLGDAGIKAAIQLYFDYGSSRGRTALPVAQVDASVAAKLQEAIELEKQLCKGNKQAQHRL